MVQNRQIKVLSVFGTRPEAIKMAPLAIALNACPLIEHKICVTAQHREMLDQVLHTFHLKPDYDLNIMKDRQTLTSIITSVLEGVSGVLSDCKPDIVLVHGDTSTTFSSALAAFYQQILVGHVEAGLRTYDKYSPFPEEMNRQLTSRIAGMHFAPTSANKQALQKENITEEIYITGNTVIDALKYTVKPSYQFTNETLRSFEYNSNRLIILTAHRRENIGKPLENICNAVKQLVTEHPDVFVVYPVHMNPVIKETVCGILNEVDRVYLIDPVDVEDMHNLIAKSYLVLTDSGGLQEEAPSLGKPVLVLRTETERPEALYAGTVKLAGIQQTQIFSMAHELINDPAAYEKMARAVNPYGDGNAAERIVNAILYHFGWGEKPRNFSIIGKNENMD